MLKGFSFEIAHFILRLPHQLLTSYYLIDSLHGTPAVLSVSVLIPCLSAEQLLVTVDTHTGMIQCHIPQYNRGPPSINELQYAFNTDRSRIPALISEIR